MFLCLKVQTKLEISMPSISLCKDINPYSMTSIMHTKNIETEKKLKQAQPRFSHVEMGGSHG